jgi:hypothetical protein
MTCGLNPTNEKPRIHVMSDCQLIRRQERLSAPHLILTMQSVDTEEESLSKSRDHLFDINLPLLSKQMGKILIMY